MKALEMKTLFFIFGISVALICLESCSKESPTSPDSGGPYLVMSSNFEGSGAGDLGNWKYGDSNGWQFVKFSNDVPPNGGKWSLVMLGDSTQRHHLYYKAGPFTGVSPKIVSFSYDLRTVGKYTGILDCNIWSDTGNIGWSGSFGAWYKWGTSTHLKTLISPRIDSVVLDLSLYNTKPGDSLLVDNFKMEFYSR